MGLFGGSTSRSGSGQKWAVPYAKAAAGNVQDVFSQNQPQLQQITKGVTDLLPGISSNYQGWQPQSDQAQGYIGDVLGGKFLDPSNNPGIMGILNRTRSDVTNDVNSQFSMAGRYGSGAHTGVLTDKLADAENNVLYNAYNTERGYQNDAATIPAQIQNQTLAQLLQSSGLGAELPYTGTNSLANSLAALFSGSKTKGPGLGSSLLTAGAQAGASALVGSDPRLKTNIDHVGSFDDGLLVYEFDYIDPPSPEIGAYMPMGRHLGVMADQVAELRPWALGPVVAGYQVVDYGAL